MAVPERYNRINIHHHLRDDVVVLLPHVAFRFGITAFGDGAILPRLEVTSIGDTVLRMLDFCATADTGPLEEKRDAAMEKMRRGFDLSYDEQFPAFSLPDNWGRIYERYSAIVANPWVASRYFADASISDHSDDRVLTLDYLQLLRKDRGVYTTAHSETIDRTIGAASIGEIISERLDLWRPRRGFLSRLIG